MRAATILSILLAVGVLIQISIGEFGARGLLLMAHALIGLAGVPLAFVALLMGRKSMASLVYGVVLILLVLTQATLGTIMIGWLPLGPVTALYIDVHRYNAYLLLIVGAVGGVIIGRQRRRQRLAETVSESSKL
jgi:hypothetical protein